MNEESKAPATAAGTETTAPQGGEIATPQEGATPAMEEKTFTQDEVNRIVQERLAKERARNAQTAQAAPPPRDKAAAAFAEREQALSAREARLWASELAQKWNRDAAVLEGFSREEIDTISKGLNALGLKPNPNRLPDMPPAGNVPRGTDAVRQAMGLQR